MKIFRSILITLIFFLVPSYSYSLNPEPLRISLVKGDVRLETADKSEWLTVSMNMPLMEGDRLWVPDSGRIEIQTGDGAFLRLDENSSLIVDTVGRDFLKFYLTEGRVYVNFRGLRNSVIQIDTTFSSLSTNSVSKFRIDLPGHDYAEVSVFKGVVYSEDRNGMIRIHAGETLSLGENRYADISPLGLSDEWERWNKERDRRFEEQRYSYRYLPQELRIYDYELDQNGKWIYIAKYGYVWVPTVYVSTGWSPYRAGRWVWLGSDYMWVSGEPWGWVPYHYGRWAFSISTGWFWVPPATGAVYWGPGFVGWVYTPTYVAWVPLAPEDIYYGYGYYGPMSVNIIHIDIHKTVINNVYKNVYVNNAVTVVHKDNFITGKYVDYKIKENPFIHKRAYQSSINTRPDRTSFTPIRKEKAPAQIINKKARTEYEGRPAVTRKQNSYLYENKSQQGQSYTRDSKDKSVGKSRGYDNRYPEPVRQAKTIEEDSRFKDSTVERTVKRPREDGYRYSQSQTVGRNQTLNHGTANRDMVERENATKRQPAGSKESGYINTRKYSDNQVNTQTRSAKKNNRYEEREERVKEMRGH